MQSFPKSVFESMFQQKTNRDTCTNVLFAELRDGIVSILDQDPKFDFEDVVDKNDEDDEDDEDNKVDVGRFKRLLRTKYNTKADFGSNLTIWRSLVNSGFCVILFTHPARATLVFQRVVAHLTSLNRGKLSNWAATHQLRVGKLDSCVKLSHFIFAHGRPTRVNVKTTAEFEDVLKQTYAALSDSDIQSGITHWNNVNNCVVVFQPPFLTNREKRINAAVAASVLGLGAVLYRQARKWKIQNERREHTDYELLEWLVPKKYSFG